MSDKITLAGSAAVQTGVTDSEKIAFMVAQIIETGHSVCVDPEKVGEGTKATLTIDLQDESSLKLLRELRMRFGEYFEDDPVSPRL
ncbi:hypothetical protein [Streptomyces sp. NPDC085529]|uniref:hypothetical protein n=1 Tax=Streptomyces sp. NPDC085529 TaxID=3365729 RepID=UPI0037D24D7C